MRYAQIGFYILEYMFFFWGKQSFLHIIEIYSYKVISKTDSVKK